MNRMKFAVAAALAAGLSAVSATAQAPAAATAPAAAAAGTSSATPVAMPAKIAVIAFEQAVVATNEGQRAVADIQKKYEPQKAKIDAQAKDVEALKAKLQALPASAPDDQRAPLIKDIDTKEKQLQLDADTAQNSYQDDLQKAYGTVAQKVGGTAVKYCQDNGYTLLLNVGGSQNAPNPILWPDPRTDVTQAVINAYNATSGVAPPPAATPSAPRPRPSSTTPRK